MTQNKKTKRGRKSKKQIELEKRKKIQHGIVALLAVVIMLGLLYFFPDQATRFKASIMELSQPFDGTTSPVKKSPDYVALTEAEREMQFSQIPPSKVIPMPKYNPSNMSKALAGLGTSDAENQIRNELITYSVPYLGSYTIASGLGEGKGSHPAVDIKIPEGTPVYAIANGVASKVSQQSSGFGKHVVIMHPGAPSLEDPNKKETLYSSYSHLSSTAVSQNQIIKKGELIGYSGSTGTSTTPHLHFQIDKESAPFHPYWPFTSAEASAAGLNFFTAVNSGFGKSNVVANTVNPMMYVQKYANYQGSSSETPPADNGGDNQGGKKETLSSLEIIPAKKKADVGESISISIKAKDENNSVLSSFIPEGNLSITTSAGTLDKNSLSKSDFDKGEASISLKGENEGKALVTVSFAEKSYSAVIYFQKPKAVEIASDFFSDVPSSHPHYEAIKQLKEKGVISGDAGKTTFRPNDTLNRGEVLAMLILAFEINLKDGASPFADVPEVAWYKRAIVTAVELGIAQGYPDKTFKPANKVNRAEFFAMLIATAKIPFEKKWKPDPFIGGPDVWYGVFAEIAKEKKLLDFGSTFIPLKEMTRGETAEAIWRLIK